MLQPADTGGRLELELSVSMSGGSQWWLACGDSSAVSIATCRPRWRERIQRVRISMGEGMRRSGSGSTDTWLV
jgi:hypothetical protein